ncbi:hypothetical protein ACHAWO_007398 [Cyclotella atomus]|uniref:CRAL-TRIO domain-containing protein n=1 Tax=Cyclotella atomus TaxID=382360 RepID=A0ABD3PKA0_9STRA
MFSGLGDVSNLFAAAAAANLHSLSVSASAAAPAPTSSIPTSELSAAAADQLGLSGADASNATVESATAGIAAVHEELEAIPISDKAAYAYAQQTKPELVGDEEVFKFLLAENFDAPNAARRLIRYWNERYRIFGQDKFCLPLTLKGALKDDSLALSRGYVQILPQPDTAGRALIYVDWSCHEPSVGYSVESMHRVFWYIVHVAMEDIEAVKKGIVVLIYPQEARLDQFDHHLWKSIAESCTYVLPVQWRSTHIVHPNRFFSIIHPLFMSTLPQSVQDRVIVHSGTKMKVLANLLRYCLPWDRIPSDVGGCFDLDLGVWLSNRMVKEDQISNVPDGTASGEDGIGNLVAQLQSQAPDSSYSVPSLPQHDHASSEGANNLFGTVANQMLVNLASNNDEAKPPSSSKNSDKKKNKTVAKGKASGKASNTKSGRKSDPRMDRAVEAKLADQNMSLVDALRAGGFDIPSSNGSSGPQYVVVDGDNVKITQRKNQLLRRLRTSKTSAV